MRVLRASTCASFAVLVALAGCAAAPQPTPGPAPPWGEAGRVIGGRMATIELAEACARAFPDLAPVLARAIADWRWRNDALAVEVEDALWRSVRARGADDAAIAAGMRELHGALAAAGAEVGSDFDRGSVARRERYCRTLPDRLMLGDEDLARRYPRELRSWHPAAR